jgi:hypothetical protein
MYPAHYASLFPAFPRDDRVFVAMSFADAFTARWERVLIPAIGRLRIDGRPVQPFRVDTRTISSSVLTEILDGISAARLVLADISSIGASDGRPVRNGNVMYEVGLAHALRLPEEVVLFRSDQDDLLFDVANVRVNRYDPDNHPDDATAQVAKVLADATAELDLTRHLAVQRATATLDYPSLSALFEAAGVGPLGHPPTGTVGQTLGATVRAPAIARLLELGAFSTAYTRVTREMLEGTTQPAAEALLRYTITPFGVAILQYAAEQMGVLAPEIRDIMARLLAEQTGGGAG